MPWMKIFTFPCWPLLLISVAMIVAAIIDGWKFKVPNWLTLPMITSGWLLGGLYGLGWLEPAPGTPAVVTGWERLAGSFVVTGLAFATLGIFWLVGAMGAGDVKMQMGFGAWIGAFFGLELGRDIFLWGFAVSLLVGGVIGLVMILVFGEVRQGLANVRGFFIDLVYSGNLAQIQASAKERKTRQRRLPYGIPLCIGFVGYLFYYMSQ